MKTAPRSQLIQKQREKELQLANSSVANLEKRHAATERELESYKKEIIKTINGTGSFGADILGEMIEETRKNCWIWHRNWNRLKQKRLIWRVLPLLFKRSMTRLCLGPICMRGAVSRERG